MLIKLTEKSRVKVVKALPLNENNQLVEAYDGNKYKSRGAYVVEISRYDHKNLNGRIYTERLWDNVCQNQKHLWEGSVGLLDHPTNDGSQKDVFCVYHNLRKCVENKTILADLYLVGRNGQDVQERIDAGGYIELSSSGLGEIGPDGKTVVVETYLLERPGDLVFNASQEVKFDKSNEMQHTNENVVKKDTIYKEETNEVQSISDIDTSKNINVNQCEDKNMTTFEERSFRLSMNGHLNEARSEKNISNKIARYKELISYCEGDEVSDLRESLQKELDKVHDSISSLQEKSDQYETLNEKVSTTEKEIQALTEKNLDLESELKSVTELSEELKSKANQFKEFYQKEKARNNTMISADEYKEKIDLIETLEKTIKDNNIITESDIIVATVITENKEGEASEGEDLQENSETTPILTATIIQEGTDEDKTLEELYEDWVKQDENIAEIKDEILNAKSVKEAHNIRLNFLNEEDNSESCASDNNKLNESVDVFDIPKGMK